MLPSRHESMEVFATLARCASAAELAGRVTSIARVYGVGHWQYLAYLPVAGVDRERLMLGDYPGAWLSRYRCRDYLRIDPIVAHCHDHVVPVEWSTVLARLPPGPNPLTRRIRKMFDEAAGFGLEAGLSIPMHGPGRDWGLMSFAGNAELAPRLAAHAAELHLLAHFVHEQARRCSRPWAAPGDPANAPGLSRREREVLHWAATGKSHGEIGGVLGIRTGTVAFHARNAGRKLGAPSLVASVARAVRAGLIDPC